MNSRFSALTLAVAVFVGAALADAAPAEAATLQAQTKVCRVHWTFGKHMPRKCHRIIVPRRPAPETPHVIVPRRPSH